VLTFSGTSASDDGPKAVSALIAAGLVAGVKIQRENVVTASQLSELIKFLSRADKTSRLMVIAEENGGKDSYLTFTRGAKALPSQREVGQRNNPHFAHLAYQHLGATLASYGINVNLGPILRATADPKEQDTFGGDVRHVAAFTRSFILGHKDAGVTALPVLDADTADQVSALATLLSGSRTLPIAVIPSVTSSPATLRFPPNRAGEKARVCGLAKLSVSSGAPVKALQAGCDLVILPGGANPRAVLADYAAAVEIALRDRVLDPDQLAEAAVRSASIVTVNAAQAARRQGPALR
jgi:beta-N-acetylhexosaminidase